MQKVVTANRLWGRQFRSCAVTVVMKLTQEASFGHQKHFVMRMLNVIYLKGTCRIGTQMVIPPSLSVRITCTDGQGMRPALEDRCN